MEKKIIKEEIGRSDEFESFTYEVTKIDKLLYQINSAKDKGADLIAFEFSNGYELDSDEASCEIVFLKSREETDEEYNKRVQKEKTRQEQQLKYKLENAQRQLKSLKKHFPELF